MGMIVFSDALTGEEYQREETPEELAERLGTLEVIPESVTKVQFARHLRFIGQWANVKAAAANLSPDLIEDWAITSEIGRYDPLMLGLQAELGLTDEQVDTFFRKASEY